MTDVKLSKRAEALLKRVRDGKWYTLLGKVPKAMAELEAAGLVGVMGRVAVIRAAYVPEGSLPLQRERLPKDGGRRLVILESPYAGDVEQNVDYARRCIRDSLLRGEAPIASHLLYTQPGILSDSVPAERAQGIAAGLAWLAVAHASVVYIDRGISAGMGQGIQAAKAAGIPVEYRQIADGAT